MMVLGDLNVNLDEPRNKQEAQVAAAMDSKGLACAMRHFRVRTRRRCKLRGGWAWRKRRRKRRAESADAWYHSKPDYFLMPWRERRKIVRCRTVMLPGHNSDHRALVAKLHSGSRGCMDAYRKRMQTYPSQHFSFQPRPPGMIILTFIFSFIPYQKKSPLSWTELLYF